MNTIPAPPEQTPANEPMLNVLVLSAAEVAERIPFTIPLDRPALESQQSRSRLELRRRPLCELARNDHD